MMEDKIKELCPISFATKVYRYIVHIPKGKVITYGDIAKAIGSPKAARAVGNALHNNPTPIIVPCHRVVNKNGELAKNFGLGGIDGQRELLEQEEVEVINNKVNLKKYFYKETNP